MDDDSSRTVLSWSNVALALSFVLFDAAVSAFYRLGISSSLITAALRCIVQLSIMGLVLQNIFETKSPWGVAGLALLLNLLGTFETVANKCQRRHDYMFLSVFFAMLCSTIPVSIIGVKYAMGSEPFWAPSQYVPVVGMLCGNAISGIVVSLDFTLKEIQENRDKVQTYLAFGASRFEACRPVAKEALRLALTPTVNQMSVIGLISIPGMMTGSILGGSSVTQAARLQMVIIFMLSASITLASIIATVIALSIVVDSEHRIRVDKIDSSTFAIWRARKAFTDLAERWVSSGWSVVRNTLPSRSGRVRLEENGGF